MKILLAVLGSSAVTAIVTTVFNMFQSRKQNSLNYITEERKIWRDKVRTIADSIQNCKFHGTGENNIMQYMVQLEMNINTYGINHADDINHDGHIWNIIERIKIEKDEKSFEKEKETLLHYISFMLKNDWEKSKIEIKGLPNFLNFLFIGIVGMTFITVYYFLICRLQNLFLYIGYILFTTIFPLVGIGVLFHDMLNSSSFNKGVGIRKERQIDKGLRKKWVCMFCLVFFSFTPFVIHMPILKNIEKDICFKENHNEILIYENLNPVFFQEIEEKLTKELEKSTRVVHNKKNMIPYNQLEGVQKNIINSVISDYIGVYEKVIYIICIIQMPIIMCLIAFYGDKKRKHENSILNFQRITDFNYSRESKEVCNLIVAIESVDDGHVQKKNELLDLEYALLTDIKKSLDDSIATEKSQVRYLSQYEELKQNEEKLNTINECRKKIKAYMKVKSKVEQRKILEDIRKKFET